MRSQSYPFPVPTTSRAWEESQSAYLRGNGCHFYNFRVDYPRNSNPGNRQQHRRLELLVESLRRMLGLR